MEGDKGLHCEECLHDGFNKKFSTMATLSRHKKTMHAKQYAQFRGMIDGSEFNGKRVMVGEIADKSRGFSHDQIDQPDITSSIVCPFCSVKTPLHLRSFMSRTGFIAHVQFIHHNEIDDSAPGLDVPRQAASTISSYIKAKMKEDTALGVDLMMMGLEEEAEESGNEDHDVDLEDVASLLGIRNDCSRLIQEYPFDFVNISRDYTPEKSNRFKLMGRSFDMRLNSRGEAAAALGLGLIVVESLYKHLVKKMVNIHIGAKPFYVSFCVDAEDLTHPITSPYLKASDVNVNRFLTDVSLASTSHPVLFMDNTLTVSINCFGVETSKKDFKELYFGGPCRNNYSTDEEFIIRKRGFHAVVPNIVFSHDCLLVSVILGVTLVEKKKCGENWRKMRMFTKPLECRKLGIMIVNLAREFPLINFNSPQSLDICPQFQAYLNRNHDIQLKIYIGYDQSNIGYEGLPVRNVENQINLIFMHNHLSLISDVLSFFGAKECSGCLCLYKKRQKAHRDCPNRKKFCHKCGGLNCNRYSPSESISIRWIDEMSFPAICQMCNGLFPNKHCFMSHKYQTEECAKLIYCITCGRKMKRVGDLTGTPAHGCLIITCQRCNCKSDLTQGQRHLCTIQKVSLKDLGILKSWSDKTGITYHDPNAVPLLSNSELRIENILPNSELIPESKHGSLAEDVGDHHSSSGLDCSTRPTDNFRTPSYLTAGELAKKYIHIVGRFGLVAYDIETRTCTKSKKLYPYALTAIFVCSSCAFINHLEPEKWLEVYDCCGIRKRSYIGAGNIKNFIIDLFFKKRYKTMVAFSFNGAGFDNVFILDLLLSNGLSPKVNMIGRKIMQLKLNGVILKDLRLYLSGRLADIPVAFNFEHVVKKGFFPFLLSNYVKDDYRSKVWPSIKYYQPHLINSIVEKRELADYINEKTEKKSEFIFMEECIKYCMQDSIIVLLAVLSLEKTTLDETSLNISFIRSRSYTLAGLSATYYRHIFMKRASIGLVPPVGYAFDKQSIPGEIYFRYMNMKRKNADLPIIQYNRNNVFGELRVNSYKVDGHTESALYEYHGCFWHASPCCYSKNLSAIHPIYKLPFYQIQYMDRIRTQRIREITKKPVIIINHCKVMALLKKSREFKDFYTNQIALNSIKYHVDIRGALYGGRVEPFGISCRLTPSEIERGVRIKMLDVVSLYPYIQMTSIFPKNLHPLIVDGFELTNNGRDLDIDGIRKYFGVFSLFYIPSKNCMFPVVPFRHEGKIVFGNCRKCMINKYRECCHSDSERGFNCMLNSVDLEQGVIDGGRVGRIYEIYDWGRGATRTDLFSDMIKHLIKGKIMSKAGAENISVNKKRLIIEAYKKIGIELPIDGWKSSPAKYQYYKILLNSLWGKLAQRPGGYTEMIFAKSFEEIERIMEDGSKEVQYIHEINPTMVGIQTKDVSDLQSETPAFYNPFIASLVTSYSRLLITNRIRTAGAGALYTDTDSIIYKSDPDNPERDPPVDSNKLIGSLVSEFEDGIYISKIVMLASKSYIIELADERNPCFSERIIKLKGISMKLAARQSLSVELMEKIALGNLEPNDCEEFYTALERATTRGYVRAARDKCSDTGYLNIPQPLLKKNNKDFGLTEKSEFVKRIGSNTDKRIIRHGVIFRDKKQEPYENALAEFPSVPFGFADI